MRSLSRRDSPREQMEIMNCDTALSQNMTISSRLLSRTGGTLALAAFLVLPGVARADFSGYYAPTNWVLQNLNANGTVQTATAPASITLVGGDNGSFLSGSTTYTTTAYRSGTVSFNWLYTSADDFSFDNAGWLLNGNLTLLTGTLPWNGSVSFAVNQGDVFGFSATTVDNVNGAGSLKISQFSAPIPEPATSALLLLGAALFAAGRRSRN